MVATLIGGCAVLALVAAGLSQTVGAVRMRDRFVGLAGFCVIALVAAGLLGGALASLARSIHVESLSPAEGLAVAIVALGHGVLVAEIVRRRRRRTPERERELERARGRRRERMPPRLEEPP